MLTFLDVTKAYDKAWLDGILYNLYNRGVTGPTWNLIRKLNLDLKADIKTKHGLTREINMKDSIRQGGVLSVILYSAMMDEIAKAVSERGIGIPIPKSKDKIGCLLWMDDVVLLSDNEKDMQDLLDITYTIAGKYHIEFGEEKSKTIKMNMPKKDVQFKLGTMDILNTEQYKYLGEYITAKNDMSKQIKELKGKTEAALQTILSIAGDPMLRGIQMGTIWKLLNTCIMPIILYGSETWNLKKKEEKEINQILDNVLKRILMVPTSTPREVLYIETGLIEPTHMALRNRINMLQRLKKSSNELIECILNSGTERSWKEETLSIILRLRAEHILSEDTQHKAKNATLMCIKNAFKQKITEEGREKSKVNFLLDQRGEWTPGKTPHIWRL